MNLRCRCCCHCCCSLLLIPGFEAKVVRFGNEAGPILENCVFDFEKDPSTFFSVLKKSFSVGFRKIYCFFLKQKTFCRAGFSKIVLISTIFGLLKLTIHNVISQRGSKNGLFSQTAGDFALSTQSRENGGILTAFLRMFSAHLFFSRKLRELPF